jgi:hypothetical protein
VRNEASPQPGRRRSLFRTALLAGALAAAGLASGAAPASAIGPPNATFSYSPSAPTAGQTIRFDASATTEPPPEDPTLREYRWDLDNDGAYDDALGVVVTHAFPAAGSYPVGLLVRSSDRITSAAVERTVTVAPNRPPRAAFFAVPVRPAVDEVVQLTSVSSDPEGRIQSHSWDLDADGAFDDARGPIAFTVFGSPGRRLVRLRVTDGLGAVSIGNLVIVVGEPDAARFPLISPFPVVRLAGSLTSRGARIRILSVSAPAGSRVEARCRGRLCPRRRAVTRVRRSGRPVRIRSFERRLQAGVVLEVLVSRPGMIGKHTRFVIRRGRAPKRRDGCLLPGSKRRSSCPRR